MEINRDEQCADSVGGVSDLYVFPYVKYSRSQIKVVDNILIDFPFSLIYDLNALQSTLTETPSIEDGGIAFAQTGSFQINKIKSVDSYRMFLEKDWRIIIRDNNGNYRLIGLQNGVKIKYTKEIGTNLVDFNGFKMSFDTKEEYTAPFITNLDYFDIDGIISLQQELQYNL